MSALSTVLALLAFAANSLLCRVALAPPAIDPWSFAGLRLGSGALVLALLVRQRARVGSSSPGRAAVWRRAGWLLLYALPFSLAYVALDAGTGALLLFGSVQLTMLGLGILRGERPRPIEWLAIAGAAAGVVYLVLPGVTAPDPLGAALMVAAGVGWGLYSLAGRHAGEPVAATAAAFSRAALVALPCAAIAFGLSRSAITARGALLALLSGAVTSGLGYVVWYAALRSLTATRAALVQLAVPPLAVLGGVLFLGERLTTRLLIASVVILSSIALGVLARRVRAPTSSGIGPRVRP
ncbi:MAG: DMT family transporter [Planctomycetes bacterium]|nr:DMT family transporter [Planctomycetota bacterium]